MERKLLIYLAIGNPILLKGFEGLIISQIAPNAEIIPISSPQKLFELNFKEDIHCSEILIFDSTFSTDQYQLLLFNLLKDHQEIKGILLTEEFNYKQFKTYFNIGIAGVMNKDIKPEDFVEFFNDVLNDQKALAPYFRDQVVKQFCTKDENFPKLGKTSLVEEQLNHFEDIYGLTKREKEILCLICNGKNTKEISDELFISLHTAETHRRNILAKLDVKNTAEMVKVAVMNRMVAV